MSTVSEPEVKTTIADRLRKLISFIETHDIDLTYAIVHRDQPITIVDRDFERLFKGRELTGKRRNAFIEVECELDGMKFNASLYRPIAVQTELIEPVTV